MINKINLENLFDSILLVIFLVNGLRARIWQKLSVKGISHVSKRAIH